MPDIERRDDIGKRLLDHATDDPAIVGAALTGSGAEGGGDQWSDIDLVFAVRGEVAEPVTRWTRWLESELGAVHHWDLVTGARVVRVFLLADWLELDLNFVPEAEFGPRGPQWRTIFGREQTVEPFPPVDRDQLIGLAWHHALHARNCIERGRGLQAEHWIGALRGHLTTMACLRLDLPAHYAKGAHRLPSELQQRLASTFVSSIDSRELRRALAATNAVLVDELWVCDPDLAERLAPMLVG